MSFWSREEASAQALGFIVAIVMVGVSVGTVVVNTQDAGAGQAPQALQESSSGISARQIADMMWRQGRTSVGAALEDPADLENVTLMGLLDDTGAVDYDILQNLNDAPWDALVDGSLSYTEALGILRMDGYGFHMRGYPTLEDTSQMLEQGRRWDDDLQVAYIGNMWRDPSLPSIRTCIMLVDADGDPYDGFDLVGSTLSVGGRSPPAGASEAAVLPSTQVNTPLPLNTRLMSTTLIGSNDAVCQTHYGLPLGSYYYDEGHASTGSFFESLYNDLHVGEAASLDEFYVYQDELFDADPANDDDRDTNADGHIELTEGTPQRTVVAVFRVDDIPTDGESYDVFCHKPGTRAEKTMRMKSSFWTGHQGHGDTLGPCGAPPSSPPPDACTPGAGFADCDTYLQSMINGPHCRVYPGQDAYEIYVEIENGGSTTTQFNAVFTADPPQGASHAENANSLLLAPGQSGTLSAVSGRFANLCNSGAELRVDIADVSSHISTLSHTLDTSVTGVTSSNKGLYLDTTKPYYTPSEDVKFHYDGDGLHKFDDLTIRVYDAAMNEVVHGPFDAGKAQDGRIHNIGPLAAGEYTATITADWGGFGFERILVTHTVPDRFTSSAEADTADPGYEARPTSGYSSPIRSQAVMEASYLEDLFEAFCPYYYDAPATPSPSAYGALLSTPAFNSRCLDGGVHRGDVYPDDPLILDQALVDRLGEGTLDILIVGSDVYHNAMTHAAAKMAIRDWVVGGGTLAVMGSDAQRVEWLAEIFDSGIVASTGGLSTPDTAHPMLHAPNRLPYDAYDDTGHRWLIDAPYDALFTQVIGSDGELSLALSNGGAFGDGRVVVSSYEPHNLLGFTGPINDAAAKDFLMNLALQRYQELYIDYGPELPGDQSVTAARRTGSTVHPTLGDVPMTLEFFFFRD